jgi:hypothetical protein
MDHSTTPRSTPRVRLMPRLALAGVIALLFAGLPSVAGAIAPTVWVVHQGQAIQPIVEQARTGDTIQLDAGTWTEAVCVNGKGLRIVGAGADQTKIVWPEWDTPADLTDEDLLPLITPGQACWDAWASADPESSPGVDGKGNGDDVSGLFFLNPAGPVSVTGLQTVNHPANGIVAWGARGVQVTATKGYAHDRYGILATNSTGAKIAGNVEVGLDRGTASAPNSGTAGIGIADSASAGAQVTGNRSEGWNLGIFVREARTGSIVGNTVTKNCVGVNIFDDGNVEVPPGTTLNVPAGDWKVVGNTSIANNRFCLAGIGAVNGTLKVSGTGMTVVNADAVRITGNQIMNNAPSVGDRLDFPPGGLTLLSLPLFNTSDPLAAGPVTNVNVVGNTFTNNQPWDILVGWPPGTVFPTPNGFVPPPPVGPGLTFTGNSCAVSVIGAGGVPNPPSPPVVIGCP